MKKRLEAELISIAHRILKLKNKSELNQLYLETQKLHETLTVLKFVEDNLHIVTPKIDVQEIEEKLVIAFENAAVPDLKNEVDNKIKLADLADEDLVNEVQKEEIMLATAFIDVKEDMDAAEIKPDIEPFFNDANVVEVPIVLAEKSNQISFEDILGHNFSELTFEKISEVTKTDVAMPVFEVDLENEIEQAPKDLFKIDSLVADFSKENESNETKSNNDNFVKTITFGLNDRIGFEQQLFGGSSEDMNRVLSQLTTFDTFQEVKEFIDDMVKPDYNNWDGKEDYELRFMEIIEKKYE